MSVEIPLDQMTLAEKLEVMETIWADLSRRANSLPSPDWHKEVLQERKRLADAGEPEFLDWETAFTELRNKARGDSPS